ncbi:MAG TPA: TIGR03435 family protein [Candidatus Acidoferrales bacterium]|nr:TIGR03435 family protein [Candidatus Acidoferrales bacterium]
MMRVCALLCLPAILSPGAFGESTDGAPRFQIADVHNSPHTTQPFARGPFYTGGRYEVRFATMLDLICMAYHVDPEKIAGGPTWLEMDRFDVFALVPGTSTAESRRLMLKSLLADRFNLATHEDSKPMPAYVLTAGKHPQLKESDGSGAGCDFKVENAPSGPPAGGGPITLPTIVYTCKNTGMEAFAAGMLNIPGSQQYFNNTLVVDRTELKGTWDFAFRFTPKVPAGIQTTGESIPFFDAMEKQLGLKLDLSTVPMPVIVVDGVSQKPTENTPEAMKSFPPPPTEFEVASLKPTPPDQVRGPNGPRPDIKNGRLYLPGISVKNLISIAWDLNGDEMLVGAPKWLEDDRYDILAKAPAGVAIGDLTPQRTSVPVNIDALRPMIRSLITERFQMVAHMEERPVDAYTLVAAKPKLKKADPASRTRWQEGALPDAKGSKNANSALGRLVTCQNMTMAQFAGLLPGIAPGYLHTPVLDATGLEGGWDFTFSFSPVGVLRLNRTQNGDGSTPNEASDPNGAVSLFDAVARQLGLKLEQHKRPVSVLVIEKIERKATEN